MEENKKTRERQKNNKSGTGSRPSKYAARGLATVRVSAVNEMKRRGTVRKDTAVCRAEGQERQREAEREKVKPEKFKVVHFDLRTVAASGGDYQSL